MRKLKSLNERFWPRVKKTRGCWTWTKRNGETAPGYGHFEINGKSVPAHRYVWELKNGPIPAGLFVLHACDNMPCVRESHLRVGTQAENIRDSVIRKRNYNVGKKFCDKGHKFSGGNLYIRKGTTWRQCKKCHNISNRKHRAKLAETK